MEKKKGIVILGSTGSIGTQALEVIEAYPAFFDLQVITAGKNADLLIEQALKFKPFLLPFCLRACPLFYLALQKT